MPHIEIRHGFTITFKTEEASLSEKIFLSNAFDGYEVLREVTDVLVIDVEGFDDKTFTVRVSLKVPLTYKEIDEYIKDMIAFVREQTNYKINFEPVGIKWDVKSFGNVSERFDSSLLIGQTKRAAILKNIDLSYAKERAERTKPEKELDKGKVYLAKETRCETSFDAFSDQVNHGVQGLCVTRQKPDVVRKDYMMEKTPIIWLTRNEEKGEKCLAPTDIPRIHLVITDFLEKFQDSVVLIEGLEYLITNNNFPTTLKLIQLISDKVMLHDSRLILSISPSSISDKELALLEKDTVPLP